MNTIFVRMIIVRFNRVIKLHDEVKAVKAVVGQIGCRTGKLVFFWRRCVFQETIAADSGYSQYSQSRL